MENKKHKCCTPEGQLSRYVDCVGCDKKPMESRKQSSIEWLEQNIPDLGKYIPFGISMELHAKFQQAKEMHKEEIVETARYYFHQRGKLTPKQLYNETFGG